MGLISKDIIKRIRHNYRRNIDLLEDGDLVVTEGGTTMQVMTLGEYREICETKGFTHGVDDGDDLDQFIFVNNNTLFIIRHLYDLDLRYKWRNSLKKWDIVQIRKMGHCLLFNDFYTSNELNKVLARKGIITINS